MRSYAMRFQGIINKYPGMGILSTTHLWPLLGGTYPFSSEGVSSRNPMAQTVQRMVTNS